MSSFMLLFGLVFILILAVFVFIVVGLFTGKVNGGTGDSDGPDMSDNGFSGFD